MFEEFIKDVLKKEGGYVNNQNDSGGETNYGITLAVARAHGYNGPMKDLPLSMAKQIYKEKYWDSLNLDEVSNISPSTALKLADIGVNMGVGRAAEFIQRLLNGLNRQGKDYPDISVDGDIGGRTMQSLRAYISKRGGPGETVLYRGLNVLQGDFYVSLAEKRPKDEDFLFGWLLNRVA